MSWPQQFREFGFAKPDGKAVHVYRDRDNYTILSVSEPAVSAQWAGEFLNVTLASGKVRRYRDRDNYTTI